MRLLNVIINNVLYDAEEKDSIERWENEVEIDEKTTLQDILGLADLSDYYPLSGVYSFNNQYVPYVIARNAVVWNAEYRNVKVEDFIFTHSIQNNTLIAYGGYCQAGGPGFQELVEVWNNIYPIIDQFVTVIGATGIIGGTGKWIASLFRKEEVPPQSYFDLIFSRERWNHFELAELLSITSDDSKRILASFAYEYDRAVLMFVQQPESLILKEKISKVNVLDI